MAVVVEVVFEAPASFVMAFGVSWMAEVVEVVFEAPASYVMAFEVS